MKKYRFGNLSVELIFLSIVVLLSRLPFLWAGFGSEEDSWLLALTAKNIATSGVYEMSRAPGHPLQELLYSLIYDGGLFAFKINFISALSSVIATLFFFLSLRQIGFKHYMFASYAFAFTPIVFISSTYTIDYMPAMAFAMGSFYWLLVGISPHKVTESSFQRTNPNRRHKQIIFFMAGIFLGIAIGFRITSGAMLIPFCILVSRNFKSRLTERLKWVIVVSIATLFVGLFAYLPVIKTYGLSFFTFSDQFPYPHFPKIFYKATFGVFGAVGTIAIIFFVIEILLRKTLVNKKELLLEMPSGLFWASVSVIAIYIIFYLRLPQKSAYFIPTIPFIILVFGYFLSSRAFKILCVLMTMSSFLFSINITDPLRGSAHSPLSVKFTMAGQKIFIDPLTGSIFSDYTKRLNKIAFTEAVFQKTQIEPKKIILICGWWYNEFLVRNWNREQNKNVTPVFYIDKETMEKHISDGYEIYYLPEQNLYNDQYSRMQFTDAVSRPYM